MAMTSSERRKKYYRSHKDGVLAYNKKYREQHREEFNEYGRKWRDNHREKWLDNHKKYQKKYISNNSEVAMSHRKTHYAICKGLLEKQPCEVCGEENTEAHHDDYERPLEVRWLCKRHHSEWHRFNKAKRKEF